MSTTIRQSLFKIGLKTKKKSSVCKILVGSLLKFRGLQQQYIIKARSTDLPIYVILTNCHHFNTIILPTYLMIISQSVISVDHGWSNILEPLKELMVENYLDFLPNLLYPVRNGEHSNTAFGLIFPLSFADTIGNEIKLSELIRHNASHLYSNDSNCPLRWEPRLFQIFFMNFLVQDRYS